MILTAVQHQDGRGSRDWRIHASRARIRWLERCPGDSSSMSQNSGFLNNHTLLLRAKLFFRPSRTSGRRIPNMILCNPKKDETGCKHDTHAARGMQILKFKNDSY